MNIKVLLYEEAAIVPNWFSKIAFLLGY